MRRIVIKKVFIESDSKWNEFDVKSFVVFKVNHESHQVDFDFEGGDIPVSAFWDLCLSDPDVREEIKWGLFRAERKYPARLTIREGMSGCKDYRIRSFRCAEENVDYFRGEQVCWLHVSCFGKIHPRQSFWAGDLAPILYGIRCFTFHGAGVYTTDTEKRICFFGRYVPVKFKTPEKRYLIGDIVTDMFKHDSDTTCRELPPKEHTRRIRAERKVNA